MRAYVDYKATEKMTVRLTCVREDYDSLDWALDGVDFDTIPNILRTGQDSFIYDVNVTSLSFRNRF